MKRKLSDIDEEESRLSNLLFNKTKNIAEKLKNIDVIDRDDNKKPAWRDEDDEELCPSAKTTANKAAYSEKLKQKYENLIGTPNWAKLNKKQTEDDGDDIIRTVGHLQKKKSPTLRKDLLNIKVCPKINSETGNEGPIITCVDFHPKLSVSMVAGQSGVVSLFSIGGDVNSKLHSFKLKKFKVTSAQFSPNGSEVFVASNMSHSYCIYDLVKAEPKLVQLPRVVKRPTIFQLSNDGQYIAAAIGYDEVYIISTQSRELLRSLKNNTKTESVAFSHDTKQLYCYGSQGEITVWDLTTFRVAKKFYDSGCVTASCITASQCGRLLATGSGEGIVNVYETDKITTSDPFPLKSISNLRTKITGLRFNPTSEILAMSSGHYPNAVKLAHIPSYHVFSNFPNQTTNLYQVDKVSFSPNSGYMAMGNNKGSALLYRLKHYKNY